MSRFSDYQYIEAERMTERDKSEVNSKFWNEGKWRTFVEPLLPKNCKGMTLVDMGCNAGLFLKLAEDRGFSTVIGIESDQGACRRGLAYKERVGGCYSLQNKYMEKCIDHLPVADYTVFVNSHYYFLIHDWLNYLDKLQAKTAYCIIVTAKKTEKWSIASASTRVLRNYFKFWSVTDTVSGVPVDGDPRPRKLWSLCFKSPWLERVPINDLTPGDHVQRGYYKALDKGIDPLKTAYYGLLKTRRKPNWSEERLKNYMYAKAELYKSVKEDGLKEAIIVNSSGRILDGSHRYKILKHLGHENMIVRRVL